MQLKQNSFATPDDLGYYEEFGGAYVPEMLWPNIEELRQNYLAIMATPSFIQQFNHLLQHWVGRPTPLYHATRLSEVIGAKIYLKREDLCHTGAHKVNNTIGQILIAKALGKQKIVAETGAGQHGVATAAVCALMGIQCTIYMGAHDIERQKPNVHRMKLMGATVIPATSGSQTLKDATNEAMRHWINHPTDTHYIIGSVVGPHPYPDMVARFQSVISSEMATQLEAAEGTPNPTHIVACVGGGSNAAGAFYHYIGNPSTQLIAVEAAGKGIHTSQSAASTALGRTGVLHGSNTLFMQTADGQVTEPYSISAGLDYPGIGPMHAWMYKYAKATFLSATDDEALAATQQLSQLEGIIPALETAHALAKLPHIGAKKDSIVVLCLSGRGDKDLATYSSHFFPNPS